MNTNLRLKVKYLKIINKKLFKIEFKKVNELNMKFYIYLISGISITKCKQLNVIIKGF